MDPQPIIPMFPKVASFTMIRLSLLLCAAMFVTLLIAGEDKGQLRPGLAAAVAAGDEIIVVERRKAVVVAEESMAVTPVENAPEAVIENASFTPEPPVEQPVRKVTPEPVFTLSALPATAVDPAPEAAAMSAEEATDVASAVPGDSSGEVWYVTANSVNVREGPSTDTSVVEKLRRGDAVAVLYEDGSEWARIALEGDVPEGYVALRFLAPEAP